MEPVFTPPISQTETTASAFAPQSQVLLVLAAIVVLCAEITLIVTITVAKWAEYHVAKGLGKAVQLSAEFGDFRYQHVQVNPWRRSIRVMGLSFYPHSTNAVIRADEVSLSNIDWSSLALMAQSRKPLVPSRLHLALRGLRLPIDSFGEQGAVLWQSLGYRDVHLSASLSLDLKPSENSISIKDFTINVKEIGRLSFSLNLGHVPIPKAADFYSVPTEIRAFEGWLFPSAGAALRSFKVRYQDESLVRRVSEAMYTGSHTRLGEVIVSLLAARERKIAGMPSADSARGPASLAPTQDFASIALAQLQSFASDPGYIELEAAPSSEWPLSNLLSEDAALMTMNDWARLLGLRLETGKRP